MFSSITSCSSDGASASRSFTATPLSNNVNNSQPVESVEVVESISAASQDLEILDSEEGEEMKFVRRRNSPDPDLQSSFESESNSTQGSSRYSTSTLSNSISNLNISSLSFHQISGFDKSSDDNNKNTKTSESLVFLLGRSYDISSDYGNIRRDEGSLFWLTYRRDFPELAPYGLTSDAGWGCMLRASQMLLAQALRMHYQNRDWRPPRSTKQRKRDTFMRNVMTWFADFPGADCPYSLHNMVACGLRYEKLPGEWYGPQTAAYVLRDLCHLHRRQISRSLSRQNPNPNPNPDNPTQQQTQQMFRIVIAQESCVYHDVIEEAMTQDERSNYEIVNLPNDIHNKNNNNTKTTLNHQQQQPSQQHSHPLALDNNNNPHPQKQHTANSLPWDTSLLLLIPLRLGLKHFNTTTYSLPLSQTFSLPQSVGVIGGSPRHALYFYGATSDGSKLYGLDPHTVQPSPERDKKRYGIVNITDEYLRTVHCAQPSVMSTEKIDPSLALAFYCKDREDFLKFCHSVERINKRCGGASEIFTVADVRPNYNANVGVLAEMMLRGDDSDGDSLDDDSTEDDEYVFL